jgi:UDP-N-acetylmuramoyl-tripeptide--D-alanyl-D-alanine ligase
MLKLFETAQILAPLGGVHSGRNVDFTRVGTDSRQVMPGMLFVALVGAHFDGHDHVREALAKGAAGALVSHAWANAATADADLPLVAVSDTRLGLGLLASHWRQRFALPLIAVTGSNGKTTVKEMCAAILRAHFGQHAVLATSGNLNNDIGLPLTLLKLHVEHHAAVIEMGMNHPGEIAYLTQLARPTVALVNNAQRAHLAGLGELIDVARAKGEIFAGLAEQGTAIINADDPHVGLWRELNAGRPIVHFGFASDAEVRGHWQAGELTLDCAQGKLRLNLALPGAHNARNALAAAAACLAAGASLTAIERGLSQFAGVKGRLQTLPGRYGATIIDDSYNANPDSMRAAIDVLASRPGQRILVIGDMGEVGASAQQAHAEIGAYAMSLGIEQLYALGDLSASTAASFGPAGQHFVALEALLAALRSQLTPQTTVLVKGSRFMRMERVVQSLTENAHAA